MDRRSFIKSCSVLGVAAVGSGSLLQQLKQTSSLQTSLSQNALQGQWAATSLATGMEDILPTQLSQALAKVHQEAAQKETQQQELTQVEAKQTQVTTKSRYFESVFEDDYFLPVAQQEVMHTTYERLGRLQSFVGHGNFNLLSVDEAFYFARNYSDIGEFSKEEIDFLDGLYHVDAADYGFYGEKVLDTLTSHIPKDEVETIPTTGNYLYKGKSKTFYNKLLKEVGDDLILTSGVRSMVKQMHLFIAKAVQSEGNMSKASRSLAPPGYSYHAIGDFDVGKVGFGYRNFTDDFADTDLYKRLQDLGYVQIRYTSDNNLGVRYEPWHIQVV